MGRNERLSATLYEKGVVELGTAKRQASRVTGSQGSLYSAHGSHFADNVDEIPGGKQESHQIHVDDQVSLIDASFEQDRWKL
jgi:hypothetical protein